jgi:SNF2 family DNA or RNA helicase
MLFQVRWERVILDEAHTIRNPKTMLAQGVVQLDSKFRWCLTGTPLHNKLKDIYSLFNFLKFTPFTNEMVHYYAINFTKCLTFPTLGVAPSG